MNPVEQTQRWHEFFLALVAGTAMWEWADATGRPAWAPWLYAAITWIAMTLGSGSAEQGDDAEAAAARVHRRMKQAGFFLSLAAFPLYLAGSSLFEGSNATIWDELAGFTILIGALSGIAVQHHIGLAVFLGLQLTLTYFGLVRRDAFDIRILPLFGFAWIGALMTARMCAAWRRHRIIVPFRFFDAVPRILFLETVLGACFLPVAALSFVPVRGIAGATDLASGSGDAPGIDSSGRVSAIIASVVILLCIRFGWKYLRRKRPKQTLSEEDLQLLDAKTDVVSATHQEEPRTFSRSGHAGDVIRGYNLFAAALAKRDCARREGETPGEYLRRLAAGRPGTSNAAELGAGHYNRARYSGAEITYEEYRDFEQCLERLDKGA